MSVDVKYRDSRRMISCRFVPDLAGSGLWISPLPRSTPDLESILAGNLPERARVAEVRFRHGWGLMDAPDLQISWLTLQELAYSPA